MPQYRIKPGFGFALATGKVAHPGQVIELSEDVAALHARAIDLVIDPEPKAETADAGQAPVSDQAPIEPSTDTPIDSGSHE